MKRLIFSGICLLTSAIVLSTMIAATIDANDVIGTANNLNVFSYFDLYGINDIFTIFSWLGIIGFGVGVWAIVDDLR
ncbi:MAG TPA: hypothetical protein GX690_01895 [Tenericutes bacterium]|jgi:hypothetical protein|nr:hypothetical protein [Mycoplasmatota bacterium]